MKFLFKAYACEVMHGHSHRSLLPGVGADCLLEPKDRPVKKGDVLRLELADGSFAETVVLDVTTNSFERDTMLFPIDRSFLFFTPEVSVDFRPKAIELGAKVFLLDADTSKG